MVPSIIVKCSSCQKSIKRRGDSVLALQETWHKHCFRCLICKERLKDEFFPWQNRLYCRQHYLEYYGHSCPKCSRQITGLIMVSGDVSFHPECFRCRKCGRLIGHYDNYVFEERSNLYCNNCYEVDVGKYMKFKEFSIFRKAAIHQVHVCPTQIKKHHLQFKSKDGHKESLFFGIHKKIKHVHKIPKVTIDKSLVPSLKQGDTVLEINGIPVTGTNIKQFTELLEAADTTKKISITIERIPDQLPTVIPDQSSPPLTAPLPKTHEEERAPFDPEIYDRNFSYFNFSVMKRSGSDSAVSRHRLERKLAPVKEEGNRSFDDGLTIKDRTILNRINSQTSESTTQTPKIVHRCHSLEGLQGDVANDFAAMIKRELLKAESPLHRAQSMKVHTQTNNNSYVFRPSDLETGEVIGRGFFGEVVSIKDKATGKEMVMKKLYNIDDEALTQFMKEITSSNDKVTSVQKNTLKLKKRKERQQDGKISLKT